MDMVSSAGKSYRHSELDVRKLVRWKVESKYKKNIILDLERLSINSRTLFPDLEGLAKGIWQTEIIRKCFARDGKLMPPTRPSRRGPGSRSKGPAAFLIS